MDNLRDASIHFLSFSRGEMEGFKYFYSLHWAYVLSHIQSIVKEAEMAKDIRQECFVVLWHRRQQIRDEKYLLNFLLRVGSNLSLHHLRNQENARAAEAGWMRSQDPNTGENPEKAKMEVIDQLVEEIEQLPLQRRKTILYKYFRGWSVKKIAQFFGVADQTARNNDNKGREQLKKKMNPSALQVKNKRNIPIK
jgi:RNA polymerase sigma-70 factor, ECF subfamily